MSVQLIISYWARVMKIGRQAILAEDIECETVMEGADMCATILTLGPGQRFPWHYHSTITDVIICLDGPVVVETRAPDATHVLHPGERCAVPPMTAHCVHGKNAEQCRYLIIQGVGEYDNHAVSG
jgi:quercetin dioxygenase-like cupin family protein